MNLPTPPTLRELSQAYSVTESLLHRWGRLREITREDLYNPAIVAEKLRLTAKNASPVLIRLSEPRQQKAIAAKIKKLSSK